MKNGNLAKFTVNMLHYTSQLNWSVIFNEDNEYIKFKLFYGGFNPLYIAHVCMSFSHNGPHGICMIEAPQYAMSSLPL